MKKFLQGFFLLTAGLVVLAMLLLVLAVFFFPWSLVRDRITGELSRQLNSKVEMGSLDFGPFSGLAVKNFRLTPEGQEGKPLFQLEGLEVGIHLWSLLHHETRVTRIAISKPVIHLIKGRDGKFRLPVPAKTVPGETAPPPEKPPPSPAPAGEKKKSDWRAIVQLLELTGGEFILEDEATGKQFRMKDLILRLQPEDPRGENYQLSLSCLFPGDKGEGRFSLESKVKLGSDYQPNEATCLVKLGDFPLGELAGLSVPVGDPETAAALAAIRPALLDVGVNLRLAPGKRLSLTSTFVKTRNIDWKKLQENKALKIPVPWVSLRLEASVDGAREEIDLSQCSLRIPGLSLVAKGRTSTAGAGAIKLWLTGYGSRILPGTAAGKAVTRLVAGLGPTTWRPLLAGGEAPPVKATGLKVAFRQTVDQASWMGKKLFPHLELAIPAATPLTVALPAPGTVPKKDILGVALGALSLQLPGIVDLKVRDLFWEGENGVRGDLGYQVDLSRLSELLKEVGPPLPTLAGTLEGQLSAVGSGDLTLTAKNRLHLRDFLYSDPSGKKFALPMLTTELEAEVAPKAKNAECRKFSARIDPWGTIDCDGEIKGWDRLAEVDARLALSLDLAPLLVSLQDFLPGVDPKNASGTLKLATALTGEAAAKKFTIGSLSLEAPGLSVNLPTAAHVTAAPLAADAQLNVHADLAKLIAAFGGFLGDQRPVELAGILTVDEKISQTADRVMGADGSIRLEGFRVKRTAADVPFDVTKLEITNQVVCQLPEKNVADNTPPDWAAQLRDLDGKVNARMDRFTGKGIVLENLDLPVTMDRGLVELKNLTARINEGDLKIHSRVDVRPAVPTMEGEIKLVDASWRDDIGNLLIYLIPFLPVEGTDKLSMKVSLDAKGGAQGRNGDEIKPTLQAAGQLLVRDARFTGSPAFSSLASGLNVPELADLRVESLRQNFRVDKGRIYTDTAAWASATATMSIAGWIDFNGELEQHIKILDLPRLGKRGNRILKSINDSGGIPVTGKIQHQEVKFDYGQVLRVGLEEAATEILENKKVQEEIGDLLKKKLK